MVSRSLLLLILVLMTAPAWAQQPSSRLLLPEDLEAKGQLRKLAELGRRGQWDKVVLGLDRLLAQGGSNLVANETGFSSVRAEARRRLLALTGLGRAAYLLAHEEEAKTLIRIGRGSPRPDPFERVLAEHPATPQAVVARRLLANRYVEQGNFGAALVHLEEQLLDPRAKSDHPEAYKLRALAFAFMGRRGETTRALESVGAERAKLEVKTEALLGRVRGTTEAPPAPGTLAWRRPVFGYYEVEAGGSRPWSTPQSDGSSVYVHDGSHAQAIDLATGRVRWRTPLGEVDAFLRPEGTCTLALGRSTVLCLEQRRITAIDQQTGLRLWQRPLKSLQQQAEIDFDATLGTHTPPAVIGGVVVFPLVTEHRDREVHLLGVDLETGNLSWSMFVAAQTGGTLPRPGVIASGGRCFVVTGHGAVAALNGEGELLWLRTYPSVRDARRGGGGGARFPFGRGRGRPQQPATGPASSLALAGGSLWIAPSDGKAFMALDPKDGARRGTHVAKGARLIGTRGLGVVGIDASGSKSRLCSISRSEIKYLNTFEGKTKDQHLAFAGGEVYVARGGKLSVHTFSKADPTRHSMAGSDGHLLVAGGRLVSASPASLDAYGVAPLPAKPLAAQPEGILAALGDEDFLTREAASIAVLATKSIVTRTMLLSSASGGEPEESLRATIALGELERRERLVEWRPLTKSEWQAQVPDLLNRLTHPNPEVRLAALGELGAIKDPDVNTLLAQLIEDRDQRVAFYAAGSLLGKGDRRGMRLVARALSGALPAPDRIKAAQLLIDHGQPEDADLALPALDDVEPKVRALAITAALKLSEGRLLLQVERLARDANPDVRLALVRAVTDLVAVNDRARAIVTKAITDPDDRVRLEVVKRLAKLQTVDACRVLCRALGDPTRETAKLAAAAVNTELQRKKLDGRKLTIRERETRMLALIDPRGLEEGARHKEDFNRNFVAQLSIRYLDAGGRLPVETICRFMSDRVKQIRTMTIKPPVKRWPNFLMEAVDGKSLTKADVAAISSLTLEKEANTRIQAYQILTSALSGPGRGELLAQGLADEHPTIRRDVAGWLLAPSPGKGKGLVDVAAARAILKIATAAQRPEGRTAARGLLKTAGQDRLAPHLIELVSDEELDAQSWVLAVETLAALTENAVPYDTSATRSVLAKRYQRWWFKAKHGEESGDELVRDLRDKNPSKRFMAARKAAKLPTPSMRRALIKSLEDESTGWVLKEKLQALAAISGQSFGFTRTMKLPELKACAQRFMAWEKAGAPEKNK